MRFLDELDCILVVPGLMLDQPKQVQGVGIFGFGCEYLPVDLLRFR
jgi:hypothetical protein